MKTRCKKCQTAGSCAEAGRCLVALPPNLTPNETIFDIPPPSVHGWPKFPDKSTLNLGQLQILAEGGKVLGEDAKAWGVGMRFTTGKPPVWQGFLNYFPNAIREVAKVSEFGAKKYDWNNWQQLKDGYTNCTNSLVRHLLNESEKGPEGLDDESKLLEAAHTAWNAMARLEFIVRERSNAAKD